MFWQIHYGCWCVLQPKKQGINCELVTEFAKELVWESRAIALDNPIYILGKQYHRFYRVLGQVDVIITDTSFVYGCIYAPANYFPSFNGLVLEIFNSMNNANYWIERKKPYSVIGREQTEEEALVIDDKMEHTLLQMNILYKTIPGNDVGIKQITNDVLGIINNE